MSADSSPTPELDLHAENLCGRRAESVLPLRSEASVDGRGRGQRLPGVGAVLVGYRLILLARERARASPRRAKPGRGCEAHMVALFAGERGADFQASGLAASRAEQRREACIGCICIACSAKRLASVRGRRPSLRSFGSSAPDRRSRPRISRSSSRIPLLWLSKLSWMCKPGMRALACVAESSTHNIVSHTSKRAWMVRILELSGASDTVNPRRRGNRHMLLACVCVCVCPNCPECMVEVWAVRPRLARPAERPLC